MRLQRLLNPRSIAFGGAECAVATAYRALGFTAGSGGNLRRRQPAVLRLSRGPRHRRFARCCSSRVPHRHAGRGRELHALVVEAP
jgi:hypothetical protein